MSSFEDPVEGKVLVGLIESSSLALCLWVLQCRPFHFVEVLESSPFQLFHPQLLTCSQINYHCSAETVSWQHPKIMVFLNIKLRSKMDYKKRIDLQTPSINIRLGWSDHKQSAVAHIKRHCVWPLEIRFNGQDGLWFHDYINQCTASRDFVCFLGRINFATTNDKWWRTKPSCVKGPSTIV